jgi:ERCC4-related helicase
MQKNKIILRPYQTRIIEEVIGKNSLVVLPTGAGKTLIAVLAIANAFERRAASASSSLKAVFFVPTCLLVEQQANAIRERLCHLKIAEFMGGKKLVEDFDILVSTPKAFLVAQTSHESIQWRNFVIIVFDEVHHVLKDHPYRKIAQRINSARLKDIQLEMQVVGLTASLTYSCTDSAVKKSIEAIVRELQIRSSIWQQVIFQKS